MSVSRREPPVTLRFASRAFETSVGSLFPRLFLPLFFAAAGAKFIPADTALTSIQCAAAVDKSKSGPLHFTVAGRSESLRPGLTGYRSRILYFSVRGGLLCVCCCCELPACDDEAVSVLGPGS